MATNPTYRYKAGSGQQPAPRPLGPFNIARYAAGVVHELFNGDFVNVSRRTPFPVYTPGQESSQFGEQLVVERTPVIGLNSSYGTSFLRDVENVANGGTITDVRDGVTSGEIRLQSNTNAAGRETLRSAEIARYIPGFSAEAGMGVRFISAPVSGQIARWGLRSISGNDGFFFSRDSSGVLQVNRLRNGTIEQSAAQPNFNLDPLDGTGVSGYTLDLTAGVICQIDYTWYGYGQILFGVIGVVDGQQKFIACHQMRNLDFGQTSVREPNLYLFQEVENDGATTDLELYVGGRQFAIVGRYIPKYRFASEHRTGTSAGTPASPTPLVTFQRKAASRDRSIKVQGYAGACSGDYVILEMRIGSTLTGASFGTPTNHTADETSVEVDRQATALTGGVVVWQSGLIPGQGNQGGGLDPQEFNLDIPEAEPITLCAYQPDGGTATVDLVVFRVKEEW